MPNDVAAQVQDGQGQQAFLDQIEAVQDASRPSVTIGEGMNGFKLVVRHRHADQRVEVGRAMQKRFPIRQQIAQRRFACRRRVNDFRRLPARQRGARCPAYLHFDSSNLTADRFGGGRIEGAILEDLIPVHQSMPVAQGLLCGRVRLIVCFRKLKQFVAGRDDVFDLRTGPRLQQRQRSDKHRLIGDQLGCLL